MVNASRNSGNACACYDEQILALADHRAEQEQSPAERPDMVSVTDTGTQSDDGKTEAKKSRRFRRLES
jgi:hypothetical protein